MAQEQGVILNKDFRIRFECYELRFLQTTDTSVVDICSELGTSHSHHMLFSYLSHQTTEGIVFVFFSVIVATKPTIVYRKSDQSPAMITKTKVFQAKQ